MAQCWPPWHRASWHWNPQGHLCVAACPPHSVPGTALVLLHQRGPDVTTVGWTHACLCTAEPSQHAQTGGITQAVATELVTLSGVLWAPATCRERDQGCWRRGQETRSGLTRTAGCWLHHAAHCKPRLAIAHKALPCQAPLLQSQVLKKPSDCWADARVRDARERSRWGCRHCPPWLWGYTGWEAECHRERMGQLGRVPTPYPHICVAAVLKKILYLHI